MPWVVSLVLLLHVHHTRDADRRDLLQMAQVKMKKCWSCDSRYRKIGEPLYSAKVPFKGYRKLCTLCLLKLNNGMAALITKHLAVQGDKLKNL